MKQSRVGNLTVFVAQAKYIACRQPDIGYNRIYSITQSAKILRERNRTPVEWSLYRVQKHNGLDSGLHRHTTVKQVRMIG